MANVSKHFEARKATAESMITEGFFSQALMILDDLDIEAPRTPDIILMIADCHYELGRMEDALDYYDFVVELTPNWSEALSGRANCLVETGKITEAHEDIERAIRIMPQNPHAHYVRGVLLDLAGKYRAADLAYQAASRIAPEIFFVPHRASRRTFDRIVSKAITQLPERFRDGLKDLQIFVKDLPDPEDHPDAMTNPLFLGAFEGNHIFEEQDTIPSRIYLYQRNIERISADREELTREIQLTLLHEIGHFFGMSEEDLARLELE